MKTGAPSRSAAIEDGYASRNLPISTLSEDETQRQISNRARLEGHRQAVFGVEPARLSTSSWRAPTTADDRGWRRHEAGNTCNHALFGHLFAALRAASWPSSHRKA